VAAGICRTIWPSSSWLLASEFWILDSALDVFFGTPRSIDQKADPDQGKTGLNNEDAKIFSRKEAQKAQNSKNRLEQDGAS